MLHEVMPACVCVCILVRALAGASKWAGRVVSMHARELRVLWLCLLVPEAQPLLHAIGLWAACSNAALL